MEKNIELAKKLKALSDRGVGGEKINAEKLLNDLLKKHGLTIEDVEGEKTDVYCFKASGIYAQLLLQIIKRVGFDLKVWMFSAKKVKELRMQVILDSLYVFNDGDVRKYCPAYVYLCEWRLKIHKQRAMLLREQLVPAQ